jgi:hypothetical protein
VTQTDENGGIDLEISKATDLTDGTQNSLALFGNCTAMVR